MRLYGFPPAGGSRSSFRRWARGLPDSIEMIPVEPPGRNFARGETAFRRLSPLLDHLEAELGDALEASPFALYGLSMGSLVAFELARRRVAAGKRPPSWLFVGGHRAPHMPRRFGPWHDLPDAALIEEVRGLGGLPTFLLDRPGLIAPLLETVRADAEVTERYSFRPSSPLPCPVTAFYSLEDPMVESYELAAWSELSRAKFELVTLPGGHLPEPPEEDRVLEVIGRDLSGLGHVDDRLLS